MRSVTYSMGVSLDGYIVGPDGGFNWTAPDEEVFRFWIDEIREVGVHLMGRRLYETMLYWETADQDPSLDDAELEWAACRGPANSGSDFSTSETNHSRCRERISSSSPERLKVLKRVLADRLQHSVTGASLLFLRHDEGLLDQMAERVEGDRPEQRGSPEQTRPAAAG